MMKSEILIVSIGQGDPDLLNAKSVNALRKGDELFLRTGNHPLTKWLDTNNIVYQTLDHIYENAEDFDQLNQLLADELIRHAISTDIVYAVPDAYTDNSVKMLFRLAPDSIHISVVPGISSYDLNLSSAIYTLSDSPIQIIPSYDLLSFFSFDPRCSVLITEVDNTILAGQVKLSLSAALEDEHIVYILHGSRRPEALPLYMLDRQNIYDHFTSVLIPGSDYLHRGKYVLHDLTDIVTRLRAPDGCPWDRQQTHISLRPFLIEEAWECIAAIDENDPDHMCEELGDLLFHIVFHASVAKDYDEFTVYDVISNICKKMIRRHPHVFSEDRVLKAKSIASSWEKIKQSENGHHTLTDNLNDISPFLPALQYASKIIKKLNRMTKTHCSTSEIITEIRSTLLKIEQIKNHDNSSLFYGLLLFLCCALCCYSGIDSELILHQMTDRLKDSLKQAEESMNTCGKSLESLTFTELCVYLNHVEGEIE